MAGKSRSYDAEFRAGAVQVAAETGKSDAEVARGLGVQPSTLQNRVHRARARAEAVASGSLGESERDELRRLREEDAWQRKEIAGLGMERDVLKRSVVRWVKEATE